MATKTIINCMDQTSTPSGTIMAPHQGISIIIDQGNLGNGQTLAVTPTSSATVSNVIKIQHSCQASQHQLTSSNTTTSSNKNNKLLIDINRKQTINDDQRAREASLPTAIVKVNGATSTDYSREMMKANEKSMVASVRLETANGSKQTGTGRDSRERKTDNDDDEDHDDGQAKEKSLAGNKELTKYFNESGQTAKIHGNNTSTTTITTTTITAAATTTTITTSQQVNGNSKCRENNGHFSTNQPNIIETKNKTNGQENDEREDDHHHQDRDDHEHDDHHNDDDDHDVVKFAGVGKRDSCLDFSHGKRWPGQENSSSLLTKADTATTQLYTPASSLTTNEESGNRKENSPNQQLNENSKAAAHVVKIQINPKSNNSNSSLEKQISIVKIESNLNKNQTPKKEIKNKENTVEEEIVVQEEEEEKLVETEKEEEKSKESENSSALNQAILKKSELHLNLERMVQRAHHHNTVTVTGGTTPTPVAANSAAATTTTTNSAANINNNTTGATTVTELNVTNPNYLYYTMSSGQFSPCDTLDSGTGSDLETQQHSTQSSPNSHLLLMTKKSSSNGSMNGLEMHLKTTKIRVSSNGNSNDQRNCSFTDSEESEASSLSCDSLHSSEYMRQSSTSPIQNKASSPSSKILGSYLPDSLLRDIKNLKLTNTEYEAENENEEEDDTKLRIKTHKRTNNEQAYEPSSSPDYMESPNDYVHTRNSLNVNSNLNSNSNMNGGSSSNASHLSTSLKRASLPSKTFVLNQEDGTFIDMKMNSMPRKYEADKYYNFHVNEHDNFRSFGNNSATSMGGFGDGSGSDTMSLSEYDTRSINDDVFAGYRDIRCGSATSTIRSSKGTVRGVKNRVRNGIATFLQLQQPNMKNFKEKDSGKVVLYTTSMGIIRDTYAKCSNVKQILRTLLVKFEERDVFMSVEYQQEIKERMHSEIIKVPQLFVEGQHIGDADTVERLNESGELRQLLKSYKSIATTFTCQTCGGYRLLPCPSCKGSKKSVHRNHFTAEFVALKCMNCDEVGLVKCHNC